jgi:hypothetical protein
MRKINNLFILSISIIILLSLYFILKSRPNETIDKFQDSSNSISLLELKPEQITKIVLKSKSNVIRFERQKNQWITNLNFPLIQNKIDNLANIFKDLNADHVIEEEPTDLEQYGLKHPSVIIEVAMAEENKSKIMYLGELTPTGNAYYLKLDTDPAVYTIPGYIGAKFKMSPAGFRDHTLTIINPEKINYYKFSWRDKPVLEIKLDTSDSKLSQYGIGTWWMVKPYYDKIPIATDKFQLILNNLSSITKAEKFIDDNPSDLTHYGLTEPQGELVINDGDSVFHLLIGKPMDENFIYCKKSGLSSIFTVRSSVLDILDVKPFELVEKFVFIPNIEDVDQINLSGLGFNHLFTIGHQKKDDTKEDSEAQYNVYKIDGKKTEEKLFKSIYQNLIGLLFESECSNQPKNKVPDLSLNYQLNKGSKRQKMDIKFIPYNYDFYAVSRNGIIEFLISKDQVEKMLLKLKNLIEY